MKSTLTPEERAARKRAVNKAYYDRHKGDPEFMAKINDANLKRYYTKRSDPKFLEKYREKARERYDRFRGDPVIAKQRADRNRRSANNRMWDNVVRGALKRAVVKGIPYDADLLEWAPTVWTGRCALSGIEFKRGNGSGPSPLSPSIDRIVPALGYTKANCRFILHAINALKGCGTDDEALFIARAFVSAQST